MSNANRSLVNDISNRLKTLEDQISSTCQATNRARSDVMLLAVTKTHSIQVIQAAYEAGLKDFGENYVQEAIEKIAALQQISNTDAPKWHFIGPLQSNKTRLVAEHFDWVHSVDRLKIAQRLSEQRPSHLPALNVCIQVNISNESSKSGCSPLEAFEWAQQIAQLPHLCLRGLMTIPAPINQTDAPQAPFNALADLFDKIKATLPAHCHKQFDTLSMGMSNDFVHAISAGSTMIRVGSALFGKRI